MGIGRKVEWNKVKMLGEGKEIFEDRHLLDSVSFWENWLSVTSRSAQCLVPGKLSSAWYTVGTNLVLS